MLNSLLKRSSRKIKVDWVMKISESEEILLTEDKEVLNEVRLLHEAILKTRYSRR